MKDGWDKTLICFQIVGIIIIPIAIAYFGWKLDSTIHEKDIKIKYIEVAVGILKDSPKEETREEGQILGIEFSCSTPSPRRNSRIGVSSLLDFYFSPGSRCS